jgi:glutamyl-tRNA synthetase
MSRDELVERFSFDRVQPSPAAFDYKKLDWMNGVYLRALSPEQYADALIRYLGPNWDPDKVRQIAPLVQEKLTRLGEFPHWANFYFRDDLEPEDPSLLDPNVLARARDALRGVETWNAASIETALRGLAVQLGLKPGQAFAPIRMAVTGSRVSPGLFESLELLGRDESLRRLSRVADAAA